MISRDLAQKLAPYLEWIPANGDQFFIPRPEIEESIFLVSDMVVELIHRNGESRFHFNGTVEWALDSVESDIVIWLPREEQLRSMLGEFFLSLDHQAGGYVVGLGGPGAAFHTGSHDEPSDAYAEALLYLHGALDRQRDLD